MKSGRKKKEWFPIKTDAFHYVLDSVAKFQLKLSLKLQLKHIRNLAKVSMSNFDKHETSYREHH